MDDITSERELKVDVPFHFALPDLSPAGIRLEARPSVQLAATYWDTADLRLLRRGITMRYRQGGSEKGWTLKLPERSGSGARLDRTELTWAAPPDRPPAQAEALVSGVTLGGAVTPVADMVTSRRRWDLLCADGAVAELDDDDVVVTSDGQRQTFRQIEVELTGDGGQVLDAVAEALRRAGAPPGNAAPKLERALGARLADTSPPPLGPHSTLADAAAAAIRAGLDRLVVNDPGVRLREDAEFVHQARVATRRLRSDLRTLGGGIDPAWVAAARDELRWLGGLLGDVRDADVLADRLERHRARLCEADHEPLDELLGRLGDQRQAAYGRLDDAMATERYRSLLGRLETPPRRETGGSLESLLERPWRRLRRQVRAAGPHPSHTDLHEIRIRAKQLRYAAEAVAPVLGKRVSRLGQAAAGLQQVLGDHHDAVVAEAWLRVAATGVRTKSRLLVIGQLIGFERDDAAAAEAGWRKAWKAVKAAHR